MKPIIEEQVKDIKDITYILSKATALDYTNNIDSIKELTQVMLDKLSIIDREMYCLAE